MRHVWLKRFMIGEYAEYIAGLSDRKVIIAILIFSFFILQPKVSGSLSQASSSTPGICYASFSSVYGMDREVPYAMEDQVDNSVILYALPKER